MNHYDSNYAANLDRDDEPPDDDEIITCWCGANGTYDELYADVLGQSCGGTGHVECYCGGDLCVCHRHGQEVECPGCDECPERDDDGFDDDDYDPHDD